MVNIVRMSCIRYDDLSKAHHKRINNDTLQLRFCRIVKEKFMPLDTCKRSSYVYESVAICMAQNYNSIEDLERKIEQRNGCIYQSRKAKDPICSYWKHLLKLKKNCKEESVKRWIPREWPRCVGRLLQQFYFETFCSKGDSLQTFCAKFRLSRYNSNEKY